MIHFDINPEAPVNMKIKEAVKVPGGGGDSLWKVTPSFDISFDGNVGDKVWVDEWMVKVTDEPLDLTRVIAVEGIGYIGGDEPEPHRTTKENLYVEYFVFDDVQGWTTLYDAEYGIESAWSVPADIMDGDTVYIPKGTYFMCYDENEYISRIVSDERIEPIEPYVTGVSEATLNEAKKYTEQQIAEAWSSIANYAIGQAKYYTDSEIKKVNTEIINLKNQANNVNSRVESVEQDVYRLKSETNALSSLAYDLRLDVEMLTTKVNSKATQVDVKNALDTAKSYTDTAIQTAIFGAMEASY